jgi:CxxC motif-containing protein (DUF1111 family)
MRHWIFIGLFGVFGCQPQVVLPPPITPPTALGDPLPGLSQTEKAQFDAGLVVFSRVFTKETGLGPQFNSNSCAQCHQQPVLGGEGDIGEQEDSEIHATRLLPNRACDMLGSEDGPVFRKQTNDGTDPRHPPVDAQIGQRSTPPVFGLGLLDAAINIPQRPMAVGRFGRKAQEATLAVFVKGAFATEQGVVVDQALESTMVRVMRQAQRAQVAVELSQADLEASITFLRFLAPPARLPFDAEAQHGEHLFGKIGCAQCHTPILKTGPSSTVPLNNVDVFAFTDLQVHRMGAALTDICFFNASPSEFRTAPLWGTRFRKTLLHDGRAKSVPDAISFHGGEAAKARKSFQALPLADQAALVSFLNKI